MSRCFTGDGRSRLWEVKAGIFVYSKILTVLMDNLNVLQVRGVKAVIVVYSKILTVVIDTLKCFTGDGRSGYDICVP